MRIRARQTGARRASSLALSPALSRFTAEILVWRLHAPLPPFLRALSLARYTVQRE